MGGSSFDNIFRQLWQFIVMRAGIIDEGTTWGSLRKDIIRKLAEETCAGRFSVVGRAVNKDEFVTAGGVPLREVNMDRMESKLVDGLFFAGEVLDIDGITGRFNFQSAWTTGYIAGRACAESIIRVSG